MVMVPKPQDEKNLLQDTVTKTATTKSDGVGLKTLGIGQGSSVRGKQMAVVINVTAADRASGDETYTFTVQQSDDDTDANYADCQVSTGVAVAVSGTKSTTGVYVVDAIISKPWVRLVMTAAGTTPSITYKAWLNPNVG